MIYAAAFLFFVAALFGWLIYAILSAPVGPDERSRLDDLDEPEGEVEGLAMAGRTVVSERGRKADPKGHGIGGEGT